jgi:hypothetical protein
MITNLGNSVVSSFLSSAFLATVNCPLGQPSSSEAVKTNVKPNTGDV